MKAKENMMPCKNPLVAPGFNLSYQDRNDFVEAIINDKRNDVLLLYVEAEENSFFLVWKYCPMLL